MPLDLRGLSPEQTRNIGQLALAVGGQQQQARQFQQRMAQRKSEQSQRADVARVQAKLKLMDSMVQQKLEQKKIAIQKQRADAYSKLAETQRTQAEAAASVAQREAKMLDRKLEAIQSMQGKSADTNWGPMSLGAVMLVGDKLPGLKPTDTEWKKLDTFTGTDNKRYATLFNPSTGETKVEPTDVEVPPDSTGRPREFETLGGKLEDVEKSLNRRHGVGEFTQLDPAEAQQWNDESLYAEALLRQQPELAPGSASGRAYRTIQRITTKRKRLGTLRKDRKKATKTVEDLLSDMWDVSASIETANTSSEEVDLVAPPEYNDAASLLTVLEEAGWDQEEAKQIINDAWAKVLERKQ